MKMKAKKEKIKNKTIVTELVLDLLEERNEFFDTMVKNQTKATNYKVLAKSLEKKNQNLAGFINTLDKRILIESRRGKDDKE